MAFRLNSTTYNILQLTERITTPSLCQRKDGTTYYTPLLTKRSQNIGVFKYDASFPTECVRYGGVTYYSAKSRAVTPSIIAGTYTPSSFESQINLYISLGGSRTLAQDCVVMVNNQSINISKGNAIYRSQVSSHGTWRIVGFNTITINYANATGEFNKNRCYMVYDSNNTSYLNYSITLVTPIYFN